MKQWIDNASYNELFNRWRKEPKQSFWLNGSVGEHYLKVMQEKKKALNSQDKE